MNLAVSDQHYDQIELLLSVPILFDLLYDVLDKRREYCRGAQLNCLKAVLVGVQEAIQAFNYKFTIFPRHREEAAIFFILMHAFGAEPIEWELLL